MPIFVNDDGTPREITRAWANDDGTVRRVQKAFVNDDGTVREIPLGVALPSTVDFIIVGGGGGGGPAGLGSQHNAGGGGGVIVGSFSPDVGATIPVRAGQGGIVGGAGSSSSIELPMLGGIPSHTLTAGGGAGGELNRSGRCGVNVLGAMNFVTTNGSNNAGTTDRSDTSGVDTIYWGAAGGGAGGAAVASAADFTSPSTPGAGVVWFNAITGVTGQDYGGGGGAGGTGTATATNGAGNSGGDGASGFDGTPTAPLHGLGGGGGGGSFSRGSTIGANGTVIFRYQGTTQLCSGGTVTIANGFVHHIFGNTSDRGTVVDDFVMGADAVLPGEVAFEYMLVGGGGGGSHGGGGGGEFVTGTIGNAQVGQVYTCTWGAGGTGATVADLTDIPATNGGASSISLGGEVIRSALGGGAGGRIDTGTGGDATTTDDPAITGGSGGGGSGLNLVEGQAARTIQAGAAATVVRGRAGDGGSGNGRGGSSTSHDGPEMFGGGGGGAGGPGATAFYRFGGDGGRGLPFFDLEFSPTSTGLNISEFGAGGGGVALWNDDTFARDSGDGGSVGAGSGADIHSYNAARTPSRGGNAIEGTGSGGGGGSSSWGPITNNPGDTLAPSLTLRNFIAQEAYGGRGGSGNVVIRYLEGSGGARRADGGATFRIREGTDGPYYWYHVMNPGSGPSDTNAGGSATFTITNAG